MYRSYRDAIWSIPNLLRRAGNQGQDILMRTSEKGPVVIQVLSGCDFCTVLGAILRTDRMFYIRMGFRLCC